MWRVWQATHRLRGPLLVSRAWVTPRVPPPRAPAPALVRSASDYIPPTQYDTPLSPKFKLGYALRVYWELIPVIVTTCIVLLILAIHIVWACKNKVDVVFKARSRENISRTMNLSEPTCHKMYTINQRYDPWPEVQIVYQKMWDAEKRERWRKESCNHP